MLNTKQIVCYSYICQLLSPSYHKYCEHLRAHEYIQTSISPLTYAGAHSPVDASTVTFKIEVL